MTQNKSKHPRSVWSLTIESAPNNSNRKVEFDSESIREITAEIKAKASRNERLREREFDANAMKTLFL